MARCRRALLDDGFDVSLQEEPAGFKRRDPSLNRVADKVSKATQGDLGKLLTVIIMSLRKSGYGQAANKVYTMLRPMLPRIEKRTGL